MIAAGLLMVLIGFSADFSNHFWVGVGGLVVGVVGLIVKAKGGSSSTQSFR